MTDEPTSGVEAVFTYKKQPGNVDARRIGEACAKARPGGDYIDHGLSLLQELEAKGFGIAALVPPAASPATGEDWPHIANEWADTATNGLEWLRNIRDGISTPAEAIANMEACIKRCGDLRKTPPASPSPAPAAVEYDARSLASRLREYINNPHHVDPMSDRFRRAITEAATALSTLAADKARLAAELKDAVDAATAMDECQKDMFVKMRAAEAASAAKDERIRELEAGLAPFAREADRIYAAETCDTIGDNCEIWQCGDTNMTRSKITYGDLRRARALTQPDTAPKETSHD